MDTNQIFQSKAFKFFALGIGILIILLLVFGIGMSVGFKKANFSFQWGENYHRNFGGPREGFMRDFSGMDFMGGHGVAGQIIKIDIPAESGQVILTMKGKDGIEKAVVVNEKTEIRRLMETIKPSDLKTDDFIVVIGQPTKAGQIEAKFIRVMPPPPEGPAAMLMLKKSGK